MGHPRLFHRGEDPTETNLPAQIEAAKEEGQDPGCKNPVDDDRQPGVPAIAGGNNGTCRRILRLERVGDLECLYPLKTPEHIPPPTAGGYQLNVSHRTDRDRKNG